MKLKLQAFFLVLFLGTFIAFQNLSAQITCTPGGNLFVYTNYDGGVLNINVDINVANIKIGVCTYEPVTINLSGAYVNNVTEVRYAGYVTTNNNHCSNSPSTTTINGAPGGASTSVNFLPPSTLSNPNGYSSIVCAYSCQTTSNQGGCNTADQIKAYFQTATTGTLVSYFTQYGCWSSSPYSLAAGGNCCSSIVACNLGVSAGADKDICPGGSVGLTAVPTGGATTYSWSPATGLSNPSIANPTANPSVTTQYVVTVTDGGSCSAKDTVIVNVHPASASLSLGPDSICLGASPVTLTGGSPAGGSYQGNGVSGGAFDPAQAGPGWQTILYQYVNGFGCAASATDSIFVEGEQIGLTLPFSAFCENDAPATLSGGTPAGGTYLGTGVSGGAFDPGAAGVGTHTIQYAWTSSLGCADTATATISVNPTPQTPSISAILDTLFASVAGDSFSWFYFGAAVPGNDQQLVSQNPGLYSVIVWLNGCPSDTSAQYYHLSLGLDDGLSALQVYPNPAGDWLTLEGGNGPLSVTLLDISGRILLNEQRILGKGRLDLRNLAAGMYLLQVKSLKGERVLRISRR
ncbi:MAG: T9SS type A sorting domain-containing protein [Bacteroidia bacterium]|nr:T9SS type A sorting domain-containing protein [Bacteroidia bacterium]